MSAHTTVILSETKDIYSSPTAQNDRKGFTLIELLVVISIIAILSVIGIVVFTKVQTRAKVAQAASFARELKTGVEQYYYTMGFYPPDVARGKDPGLVQALPTDPETGTPIDPSTIVCGQCPADWVNIVRLRWNGPYITNWPKRTPWGGTYDYNYWPTAAGRYGCSVPPGIYIGVQGDYADANKVPSDAEQMMIDQGMDLDKCINGEAQMVLSRID